MTTPEPPDVLKQVLEIVDMFEDENDRMADDAIFGACLRATSGFADPGEKLTASLYHVIIARRIGAAIRERFGLPPKQDEDPA